jgi:hypothetical protein
MGYAYADHKAWVFSEPGQVMFLEIRDKADELLAKTGAVLCQHLMCSTGDSWHMLACIDRLVELGELVAVSNPVSGAGQHRIYVRSKP